jgi:hypothetical protein
MRAIVYRGSLLGSPDEDAVGRAVRLRVLRVERRARAFHRVGCGALDTLAVDEAVWRSFVEASHHNLRELAMATGGSLLDDNQPLTAVLLALRARAPR